MEIPNCTEVKLKDEVEEPKKEVSERRAKGYPNLIPFKPGKDERRAAGRPPGVKNFTTKVREALLKLSEDGEHTHEELFIKSILKKVTTKGDNFMMKTVWEQLDGKPLQRVEGTVDFTLAGLFDAAQSLRTQSDDSTGRGDLPPTSGLANLVRQSHVRTHPATGEAGESEESVNVD